MRKYIVIIAGAVIIISSVIAIFYFKNGERLPTNERTRAADFIVKTQDSKNIDTPIRLEIFDIKGPFAVVTYSDIAVTCFTVLALILGAYLIFDFIKRRHNRPKVLSEYEVAIKRLKEIETHKVGKEAGSKEAYFELAHILRSYVKETFSMGKEELTTGEFLNRLDKIDTISKEQKEGLKNTLLLCDLVKFSGYSPDENALKSNIEIAGKMIDDLHGAANAGKGGNKA